MGVGDDEQAVAQVVEDQQRVGEHEHGVGKPQVVPGTPRQPLHVADHVVGEVADGATLEAGKTGHGDRSELGQQPAQRLQRVTVGEPLGPGVAPPQGDGAVLGAQDRVRVGPEEGIAGPVLAALHGLQQERVGARPQAQIG